MRWLIHGWFPKKSFFKIKYLNSRDENINKKTICILNSFKSHLRMLALMVAKIFYVLFVPIFQTLGLWTVKVLWLIILDTGRYLLILASCYWCPERGFKRFKTIRLIVKSGSILWRVSRPDIMNHDAMICFAFNSSAEGMSAPRQSFCKFSQVFARWGCIIWDISNQNRKSRHHLQTAWIKHQKEG